MPTLSSSQIVTLGAGQGYIIKAKESAFDTAIDTSDDAQFDVAVSVPIRITFTGDVVALPDPFTPAGTAVKPVWNLVGLHSERDSALGRLVQKVDQPRNNRRLWEQFFAFRNSLDITLNDQGTVVRFPGTQKPKISLEPGVLVGLFELGDQISIGSGFWLELCDDGAECTNSIGPVLEGR